DYLHSSWAKSGADYGAKVAAVGSVILDVGSEGLNVPLTAEEIALGATAGAAPGAGMAYVFGDPSYSLDGARAEPPENAWDPNGPKAPGYPGGVEGYQDPKGGPNWVQNPNGPGYGWESKDTRVWVPTGRGGRAHGGPHWDVQKPGGGYENVRPPK